MNKNFFLSKTFWVNIIMAVAVMFPQVQAYLVLHPTASIQVFAGVNLVLRYLTKQGVQLLP